MNVAGAMLQPMLQSGGQETDPVRETASRRSGCGSEGCGFEPHRPPQIPERPSGTHRNIAAHRYGSDAAVDAAVDVRASTFWGHVERGPGCWIWTGAVNPHGYGVASLAGVTHNAHRIAWVRTFGPIPSGLSVLHSCDTRRCVRPDHLMLGSQRANVRDMDAKGRRGDTSRRGASHPGAKLTDGQVTEIRAAVAAGGSCRVVGRRYGVSAMQVSRLATGKQRTDTVTA